MTSKPSVTNCPNTFLNQFIVSTVGSELIKIVLTEVLLVKNTS